jgi:hypothetical protein
LARARSWLLDNARGEAQATGARFTVDTRDPQRADLDLAALILFGPAA